MKNKFFIEKLDHFGRGITRLNDKIMFVKNAIDKEVVEIDIISDKKKIIEGTSSNIIEKSPDRKDAECPYYSICGGCNIMHINYRKQLDFKLNKVSELLEKFAGISRQKIKTILPSSDFYYRNKVSFKVDKKLSFCKNKTCTLVQIDECIICSKKINEVVKVLNSLNLSNIEEVIIRTTYKDEVMVVFKVLNDIDKEYFERNLKDEIDTFIIIKEGVEEVIFGKGFITEKIGNYYFKISPTSFFQVNTTGAEKLYDIAKCYAKLSNEENVLDLYCGTGTIGIYVSDKAKSVIGIEINSEAVSDAEENKKLNGINNVSFVCKDISKVIDKYKDIDVAIIDPPRSGLVKKAMENILEISPQRIVYISCDPATLARDLNTLKEYYEIEEITLVDMFPNTYHCESITVLERR